MSEPEFTVDVRGVWVAYYSDWSGCAVFNSEIEALRYAINTHMSVKFVAFGKDLRDAP